MTLTESLKTLDISLVKVVFLRVFNKDGLIDYILEKLNNGINALIGANAEKVAAVRACLVTALGYYDKFASFVPKAWESYAEAYVAVVRDIVNATEDGQLTKDELNGLAEKAMKLYSMYVAD